MRAFGVTRRSGDTSSRPCGCDPGTSHVCAWHSRVNTAVERIARIEQANGGIGLSVTGPDAAGNIMLVLDGEERLTLMVPRFAAEQLIDAIEERLGGDFGE